MWFYYIRGVIVRFWIIKGLFHFYRAIPKYSRRILKWDLWTFSTTLFSLTTVSLGLVWFRRGRSTEDPCLRFTGSIYRALNSQCFALMLLSHSKSLMAVFYCGNFSMLILGALFMFFLGFRDVLVVFYL